MTKVPKFTDFSRFYATFVKVSRDFVGQNIENVQQRMNSLSNRVVRGVKRSFVRKNFHNLSKIVKIFLKFWFLTQFS